MEEASGTVILYCLYSLSLQ
jgi:hypothetical protein